MCLPVVHSLQIRTKKSWLGDVVLWVLSPAPELGSYPHQSPRAKPANQTGGMRHDLAPLAKAPKLAVVVAAAWDHGASWNHEASSPKTAPGPFSPSRMTCGSPKLTLRPACTIDLGPWAVCGLIMLACGLLIICFDGVPSTLVSAKT